MGASIGAYDIGPLIEGNEAEPIGGTIFPFGQFGIGEIEEIGEEIGAEALRPF
jgi:hypothetical protein